MLGFRQRPLHGGLQRLRVALQGLFSNRPPRTQRVFLVEVNGRRFKRVVFPDSLLAREAATHLTTFGPDRIYPTLIYARENELWVEFVEGRLLSEIDPIEDARLAGVADVVASLYTRDPRQVPIEETSTAHVLETDLHFLRDVGVVEPQRHGELMGFAERHAPKQVWIGYDCIDVIRKNFVLEPGGRVRMVDVESLVSDHLIGWGVAKACVRWLGESRGGFLDLLAQRGVPDFQAYFPYVELCFVAYFLKNSFLEGKRRFVDPGLLDRFRETDAP